ncbi:MAG: amino acid regulated cytosolic protein [Devosia sp. 67-54]|uniref:YcjX family protein n=1 Tax=unclassified Devosia TaxID=196773 RepID=UPI00086BE95B|nr:MULTISPECIES: YcjX family protein [unclassified Devosia]MBN9303977.1 YcjX family protein [Devosia sp.]ODU62703.1 MAG: amino acid regulated cytosolic protein [Pelagibacterium sp. SCN 68-10]OJX17821.1 MAG: amino acid regulated cytosolic protein [Devosia sp. 67-54]
MPQSPTTITDEIGIALANLADAASGSFTPTLRLGVTGLSRAGKTIFITALIHNLLTGGRLPGFAPLTEGRFIGARLAESPDAGVPRFAYEQHLQSLTGRTPGWPESTRRISELRISLKYQSQRWFSGWSGPSTLNLDIVDYPGEWLLDLPLLSLNFAEWSASAIDRARRQGAPAEAAAFIEALAAADATRPATDPDAERLAAAFTAYLRASRADAHALSTLPPGRFLMPGDLEGSPALTFAPLPPPAATPRAGSLYAMLERRYEAYKDIVVRPFFRDHFARLDRQIVLVDTLRALNAGPAAVADLETALTDILACFRQGDSNPLTRLVSRRIDRILFAATKADHIHHTSHDRLEAILNRLVARAARRAKFAGADAASVALAAIRATREGRVHDLDVIIGTPEPGETLDGITYDGRTEIALFPGDLPASPDSVFEAGSPGDWPNEPASGPDGPSTSRQVDLKFLRFLPPQKLERNAEGAPVLPHIRFDRALDYLLGDRLR